MKEYADSYKNKLIRELKDCHIHIEYMQLMIDYLSNGDKDTINEAYKYARIMVKVISKK